MNELESKQRAGHRGKGAADNLGNFGSVTSGAKFCSFHDSLERASCIHSKEDWEWVVGRLSGFSVALLVTFILSLNRQVFMGKLMSTKQVQCLVESEMFRATLRNAHVSSNKMNLFLLETKAPVSHVGLTM